jgi:hypothetical protein
MKTLSLFVLSMSLQVHKPRLYVIGDEIARTIVEIR